MGEYEYTYNGNTSDVAKIELPGGAEYTYSYNADRQLTGTVSATGVRTTHTYDSYGNAAGTTITYAENDSGEVIKSETAYTADGNMTASVTTGDRNTVTNNIISTKYTDCFHILEQ